MAGGPSGFRDLFFDPANAPVTRTFLVTIVLLSLLFGVPGRYSGLGLTYQDIFQNPSSWKLITSELSFSSTTELVFGVHLLYYFRVFERQIGSNKHTVFILFSTIVSLLIRVLAITYLKDTSMNTLASGPYGLIFASFIQFYFDIPVSWGFRILGINLTNKSFVYLAGLQFLFSAWKWSLVPAICGVLAGSLYRLNAFGIRKIKIPDIVTSFFSRPSRPSSGNSSRTPPSRNTIRNIPAYPSRQLEGNFQSAANISVSEPSEASISMLVSMGFDSNSSRLALIQARNDINVATNILLESPSR